MKLVQVNPNDIIVKDRFRKKMGDIGLLAANIANIGLLNPIGITEDNVLVFGERRLCAVRDHLVRDKIDAIIVNLEYLLAGEFSENEFRKNFTKSERAQIGKAIERDLADMKKSGKLKAAIERFKSHWEHIVKSRGGNVKTVQTKDVIAAVAGLESRNTYERAKKVIDTENSELIDAMDNDEVSIAKAAEIAEKPTKEEQDIALQSVRDNKEQAKQKRAARTKTPKVSTDATSDRFEVKAQEIINEFGTDAVIIAEKIFKHFSAD
jgi:ParB-like nuclease family protein